MDLLQAKVLCPTQYKIGHFGDVLLSQSQSTEKVSPTQQKQAIQEQNEL